jgi:hypothetical protein
VAAEAVAVGVVVKVIRLVWQGGKLPLVWQAAAVVGLTLTFEDVVLHQLNLATVMLQLAVEFLHARETRT